MGELSPRDAGPRRREERPVQAAAARRAGTPTKRQPRAGSARRRSPGAEPQPPVPAAADEPRLVAAMDELFPREAGPRRREERPAQAERRAGTPTKRQPRAGSARRRSPGAEPQPAAAKEPRQKPRLPPAVHGDAGVNACAESFEQVSFPPDVTVTPLGGGGGRACKAPPLAGPRTDGLAATAPAGTAPSASSRAGRRAGTPTKRRASTPGCRHTRLPPDADTGAG
ncbi:hypothetical protein T492DRAFT_1078904 [Pavlovales sp. CCMP2436]|nr:hypothetical protein T492DRAFT_1078904 [Pavlovales sp. CCMP2436]